MHLLVYEKNFAPVVNVKPNIESQQDGEARIIGDLRKVVLRDLYRSIVEQTIYEQIKTFRKAALTTKTEATAIVQVLKIIIILKENR